MTSYLKTMLAGLRQWSTAQKADWNQNDEMAANYIKGRPCYEDDSGTAFPLPAKYLPQIPEEKLPPIPATIQRVGDPIILTDAHGVRWRLVVGEDGALTTEVVKQEGEDS